MESIDDEMLDRYLHLIRREVKDLSDVIRVMDPLVLEAQTEEREALLHRLALRGPEIVEALLHKVPGAVAQEAAPAFEKAMNYQPAGNAHGMAQCIYLNGWYLAAEVGQPARGVLLAGLRDKDPRTRALSGLYLGLPDVWDKALAGDVEGVFRDDPEQLPKLTAAYSLLFAKGDVADATVREAQRALEDLCDRKWPSWRQDKVDVDPASWEILCMLFQEWGNPAIEGGRIDVEIKPATTMTNLESDEAGAWIRLGLDKAPAEFFQLKGQTVRYALVRRLEETRNVPSGQVRLPPDAPRGLYSSDHRVVAIAAMVPQVVNVGEAAASARRAMVVSGALPDLARQDQPLMRKIERHIVQLLRQSERVVTHRGEVDFGILLCRSEHAPYFEDFGWQRVPGPLVFDEQTGSSEWEGATMVLQLGASPWPPGTIRLQSGTDVGRSESGDQFTEFLHALGPAFGGPDTGPVEPLAVFAKYRAVLTHPSFGPRLKAFVDEIISADVFRKEFATKGLVWLDPWLRAAAEKDQALRAAADSVTSAAALAQTTKAKEELFLDFVDAFMHAPESDEQGVILSNAAIVEDPGFGAWLKAFTEQHVTLDPRERLGAAGALRHLERRLAGLTPTRPALAGALAATRDCIKSLVGEAVSGQAIPEPAEKITSFLEYYGQLEASAQVKYLVDMAGFVQTDVFGELLVGFARSAREAAAQLSDNDASSFFAALFRGLGRQLSELARVDASWLKPSAAALQAVEVFRDSPPNATLQSSGSQGQSRASLWVRCDATYGDPVVYLVNGQRIFDQIPISEFSERLKAEGWQEVERAEDDAFHMNVRFTKP